MCPVANKSLLHVTQNARYTAACKWATSHALLNVSTHCLVHRYSLCQFQIIKQCKYFTLTAASEEYEGLNGSIIEFNPTLQSTPVRINIYQRQ